MKKIIAVVIIACVFSGTVFAAPATGAVSAVPVLDRSFTGVIADIAAPFTCLASLFKDEVPLNERWNHAGRCGDRQGAPHDVCSVNSCGQKKMRKLCLFSGISPAQTTAACPWFPIAAVPILFMIAVRRCILGSMHASLLAYLVSLAQSNLPAPLAQNVYAYPCPIPSHGTGFFVVRTILIRSGQGGTTV